MSVTIELSEKKKKQTELDMHRQVYICTIIHTIAIEAVKRHGNHLKHYHSLSNLMDFNFLDWSTITFMALSVSRDPPFMDTWRNVWHCETNAIIISSESA